MSLADALKLERLFVPRDKASAWVAPHKLGLTACS
jgi:hypothetical protein